MPTPAYDAARMASFVDALQQITDPRDNRGKRHRLPFVLAAVAIAIMAGRAKVSEMHRYIRNRIDWLRDLTGYQAARPISRAQLPRILAVVDWSELNTLVERYFGVRFEQHQPQHWVAVDGKTLRGSDQHSERTLLAVTHGTRQVLAQRPLKGPKEGEITAVRELLQKTGLQNGSVTLDALHLNPKTSAQIHQAGGRYLIQVKANQKKLKAQLQQQAHTKAPLGTLSSPEKGHGRLELRQGTFFSVTDLAFDERWCDSGFQTLIVMHRQTTELARQKTRTETAYYISNQPLEGEPQAVQHELFEAVRQHWRVESDNWIRDVTFCEDHVKTKHGNQGQVLACLRTLAMRLFRKAQTPNFRAALDDFADCPGLFKAFLQQLRFL